MTNKLKDTTNPNSSTVFHEIRVDKDIPDDLGTLGKLRMIYNGISANAWLTPVGIRHVKDHRGAYTGDLLPNELKSSIRDRAFSASGIMGRRHYELDRQELGKEEIIFGVKIGDQGNDNTKNTVESKSKRKSGRPHTVTEIRKLRPESRFSVKRPTSELPDLTITQMINSGRTEKDDTQGDKKRVKIVEDDVRFRNIAAIQEAYNLRSKSAPQKAKKDKDKNELTRSYTSMQETVSTYRGPSLKPLLCAEPDLQQHECCDDSCRGCFRACLASDDYFDKVNRSANFDKPNFIRVPRKKIPYRLRPALRMAFLEQLVISKKPQSRDIKESNDNAATEHEEN